MTLVDRFLKYVSFDTQSDESTGLTPSTPKQMVFAEYLKKELESLGLEDITLDEHGYLFATLPANIDKEVPTIGFIAHMDTSPDMTGKDVTPRIVEKYDGSDIVLCAEENVILSPSQFPELLDHKGEDLIVTNGKTLLGADDKAGIAEIVSAVVYLKEHPEIKHGEIEVGIGPDEEIGTGADRFDVKDFGADIAYTVDGGPLGELEYETFNAAAAKMTFIGKDVHPATAKGVMVNAIQLAMDFHAALPEDEVPEKTEGREGFYHVLSIDGTVDEAHSQYIVRDHDREKFEERKQVMKDIVEKMNADLGEERVVMNMFDQYYNMREVIEKDMTVVDLAKKAMENLDIAPVIYPVRGGTDGSKISFMGLPTPNLFAGGENMHARYEYVSEQVMEKAADVLLEIVKLVAED